MPIGTNYTDEGWIVHRANPEADPNAESYGPWHGSSDVAEFAGRRPVLADDKTKHIYVGAPNWYHHDTGKHFGVDEWGMDQGYFAGGPKWGNGNLKWYGPSPAHHDSIVNALQEAGFEVPNTPASESQEDGLDIHDSLWEDDDDE